MNQKHSVKKSLSNKIGISNFWSKEDIAVLDGKIDVKGSRMSRKGSDREFNNSIKRVKKPKNKFLYVIRKIQNNRFWFHRSNMKRYVGILMNP